MNATSPSRAFDGQPSRIPDATERARPEFQDARRIIEDYPTRRGPLAGLLGWDEIDELVARILDAVEYELDETTARYIAELENDLGRAEFIRDRARSSAISSSRRARSARALISPLRARIAGGVR